MLLGALTVAGLVLACYGWVAPPHESSTRFSTRLWKPVRRAGKLSRTSIVVAVIVAAVMYLATHWIIWFLLAPAAVIGLPWLLGTPKDHDVALLEALDRWVRSVGATLPTGRSVTDALRISRRQAPKLLAERLDLMVRRLDERWTVREALLALADELDSPDADAVVAALILAADRGGTGATATLAALGDSIQDRLRARRVIEAERSKPRVVVRQVTVISLVVLSGAMVFGGNFFKPYGSPTGQIVLLVLVAAYVGSLLMMRRVTEPPRRERILRRSGS